MIKYNEQAKAIYEQNKAVGWWDGPDRCIFQTLQLVSTEIAEATEGERKNLMDDHLPSRKMGEVELADALIRILDLGGRYNWVALEGAGPLPEFVSRDLSIAGKHLFLNACLIGLTHNLPSDYERPDDATNFHYTNLVVGLVATAETHGYDIEGAMVEKLEYNKKRQDHKRENRAKDGGKTF